MFCMSGVVVVNIPAQRLSPEDMDALIAHCQRVLVILEDTGRGCLAFRQRELIWHLRERQDIIRAER